MLDYIFFHNTPYKLFKRFLDEHHIPFKTASEFQKSIGEDGLTISISEELDSELLDKLELYYDEMMEMNETLVTELEAGNEIKNAGISVNLSNGSVVLADIDPGLIYKLSRALNPDEIRQLVSAIADAVENPDMRPLCKR